MSKVKIFFGASLIFLVLLLLFFINKYNFLLLFFIIFLEFGAIDELYSMFEKRNLKGNKIFPTIVVVLISLGIYFFQSFFRKNIKYIIIAGILISIIILLPPFLEYLRKKTIPDYSKFNITIFSILYISLYNYILLIFLLKKNIFFLILFLGVVYFCDIGAYFAGVLFGKRKIAPLISPKKTWEGFLGGVILSVLISLLITKFGNEKNLWNISTFQSIFLGILLSVFAQIGDFYESSIKRYCNVKDSGKLVPEHGGILDRTDSLFFTSPIFLTFIFLLK
jgi:phosphatidate cytidylyltransferase